ncbi:unnamed protein product [Lupinus luteus]|uniref:DUF4378 domain-containing protein n=1 Tax=Lupinus luteus TaxID=3873 RepID=A0AAV1XS50_LUPLU
MGRQKKKHEKHMDPFWENNNPDCGSSFFHIIKHHPLRHFMKRLGHRKDGGERNAAACQVEEKVTMSSSVPKHTVKSQIKALIIKGIPKKRSKNRRNSTCPPLSRSTNTAPARESEQSILEDKLTHSMKPTSAPSPHVFKHFVKSLDTINMNKEFLLTYLQDPVCPLAYHFNKQQASSAKMALTRSVSFPLPQSSPKRRGSKASISMKNMAGNGSLPKVVGRLHFCNKIQRPALFESSIDFWEPTIASVAKWRLHGNLDMNDGMIVRDVQSSGSAQGQRLKGMKKIKNLKQKIVPITGENESENEKEKLRVTLDSVIDKIPQGHGISDDLKKEILKKLTDPAISTKGENRCASFNGRTNSFTKRHQRPIRRTSSLEEPLDSYSHLFDNIFNTESRHNQPEQLKLRTKDAASPLIVPKPIKRILSLPDLQSFYYSYPNGEFSDVLSITKPIITSTDGTMGSESIGYPKRRIGLNVHSKCKLQLDKPVENLLKENLVSVGENDALISSNIEGPGSDSTSEINSKVGMIIDDFGDSILKNGGTFNDQDIGLKYEDKIAVAASDSKSKDSLKVIEIPQFHVDTRYKAEFNYVKYVLEISGLTSNESISAWHSSEQPLDPLLFEEMETDPDFCTYEHSNICNHHVLFDLINESLLEIYGTCCCYYPKQLSYLSYIHPMPIGNHILHEVWNHMSQSLSLKSKANQTTDFHVSRDLAKNEGWMNLQLSAEFVALEVEDFIFHDLMEEIMRDLR